MQKCWTEYNRKILSQPASRERRCLVSENGRTHSQVEEHMQRVTSGPDPSKAAVEHRIHRDGPWEHRLPAQGGEKA